MKPLITELDELHERGALSRLASAGFISSSVLMWRNIYHLYTKELKASGSKMLAMQSTADAFSVSVRTVQYIRDRLENC